MNGSSALPEEVEEVSRLLQLALSAAGDKEDGRAAITTFGEAAQAQLTVEDRVPAVASEVVRQLRQAHEAAAVKRVADVVGWDLVSSLAPHIADSDEALQAVELLTGLCPAREAHLMLMEALSTPGRLPTPAAHRVISTCLPKVLSRLPPDKRGPFLTQPFHAALSRALDDTDPEVPPDGEPRPQSPPPEDAGTASEAADKPSKRVRRREESRGVTAALDLATAILGQPQLASGGRAVTATEVGHVVGLLLRLLGRCLTPRHPPPTSPTDPLPPQLSRLLALLSTALLLPSPPPSSPSSRPDPPFTIEALLLQPVRERRGTTAAAPPPPPEEAAVSGGALAWEASDVTLAAYYLVILGHGQPLPTPLSPAYVASLLAEPAAQLLKSPMLSLQGLTAAHQILSVVTPPLGPLPPNGIIHIRQAPPPPGHSKEAEAIDKSQESSWVVLLRSLTGCMVFLSEEEARQSAYRALQGMFAVLSDGSRFRALQCLLHRPGYSKTITALLISFAQKAAAASWTHNNPSPFKTRQLRGLYEGVLWQACDRPADALAAMASPEQEGNGELDCLMSALNIHRFLLLKDGAKASVTGVWDEACVAEAVAKLQCLQSKLREAAGSGGSSSSFRLGMVDEVVSQRLLPLLLGQSPVLEALPPPPTILAPTPPSTAEG